MGKNKQNKNFWKAVFSENGMASSKRVFGAFILVIVLCCIVYLTVREGGTDVVKNLLDTAMFIGGSLLGISSITGIWKNGSSNDDTKIKDDDDEPIDA